MKIFEKVEQGSPEWFALRCGRITMSNAGALMTKGKGITRANYLMDVCAERLSGEVIDTMKTYDMERGSFMEEYALRAFQVATGLEVRAVGFVIADDERIGCSPDALSVTVTDDAARKTQ